MRASLWQKLAGAPRGLPLVIVLAVVGAIYLSTLSVNHSEAEDSLSYLAQISYEGFGEQFHPNHLLYGPINYLFLHTWQGFGYQGNAELPVKIINVVAGLCALAMLYAIGGLLRLSLQMRLFTVLATAFSYGFWWYSVECETYILPIPFILLALYLLLRIESDFTPWRPHLLLGVFSAVAILLHQQHVLLSIVIVLCYAWIYLHHGRDIGRLSFLGRFVLYGAASGGIVLAGYVLVATVVEDLSSFGEIEHWISANTSTGGYGYGITLGTLKGLMGFVRAFVGGHFLFSFPEITALMQRLVPNYELKEEIFLVQDLPRMEGFILAGLAVLLAALAALGLGAAIKRRTTGTPRSPGGISHAFAFFMLGAYVAVNGLFNLWWLPESIEFWIALVPAVALIFALLAAPLAEEPLLRGGMGVFLACLLVVNLTGSILPQTDRQHDYWYTFNDWLIKNARRGDLVVSGAGYIADGYVRFYSGADVLSTLVPGQDPTREFESFVARRQPNRIFFSSTVDAPPRSLLNRTHLDVDASRRLFARVSADLRLVHEDTWQRVFLYEAAAK